MRLETARLILRPFALSDAEDLYEYGKDGRVGPIAGWPVHKSLEESRHILKTVFSAPDTFAVVEKASGKVVGSAGFVDVHRDGVSKPDNEIGYALNPAYWGRGYIPEAVMELMRYGFGNLRLATIWCSHYEGNEKSKRVIEKCGFRPMGRAVEPVPQMGEERVAMLYALTRAEWEARSQGM
ncbi:MAG: GNAT family N-acetyltransferase [Lawsonibacter sp.]|nr:GNAT family N-acetyltransferase [Lawsonibacter sp.]